MTPKPEIVAFIGVVGSGKDHNAKILKENGYLHLAFKDALILMVNDLVGYDIRPEYEWFKVAIVGVRKPANPLSEAMMISEMQELIRENPSILTGRRLLQRLGTDVMRKRDKDYWVNQSRDSAVAALAEGRSVVYTDCRFPNEVTMIWEFERLGYNPRYVFVDYRSPRYDQFFNHESEYLAQALIRLGYKDGEELTALQLHRAWDTVELVRQPVV